MLNCTFTDDFTSCIDILHVHFDNILVIGDLNYDLVKLVKRQPLHTVCDIFDCINLFRTPTCFMKDVLPSMLDVILTNRSCFLCNVTNFKCGISDWHNIISCVIKGAAPPPAVAHKNISMRGYSVRQFLDKSSLYNYAVDNTLSYAHSNSDTLIHALHQKRLSS